MRATSSLAGGQDVPLSLRRRAAQLIEDLRSNDEAAGWEKAYLGSPIRPLYRPDLEGVAYYEFSVVVDDAPAGFLILSTGDHDFPLAHARYSGESPTQELERQAAEKGEYDLKFYKLDALAYAAENSKGELVASTAGGLIKVTGLDPAVIDKPLELSEASWNPDPSESDSTITAQSSGKLITTGPVSSSLEFTGWESWAQLKQGYRESNEVLIESQRREASQDWETERLVAESGEGLTEGTTYPLALLSAEVLDITTAGDGASYVTTEMVKREGLPPVLNITVMRSDPETSMPLDVKISYADGQTELVKFFIAPATLSTSAAADGQARAIAQQAASLSSGTTPWSPWKYHWAADPVVRRVMGLDQRRYSQIPPKSGPNTSSCFSGCGATAWAMLFGWADNQAAIGNRSWAGRFGIYRQNGGFGADAVAPRDPDAGVDNMTWELRQRMGTFCVFGQGATLPWRMDDAAGYLVGRSGIRLDIHYNAVLWKEDRLRDYAIKSIRDRHTPAIIGIGGLGSPHYPLAFGYAERSRIVHHWYGDTTERERRFIVNQGQGDERADVLPASTWFAGEIAP